MHLNCQNSTQTILDLAKLPFSNAFSIKRKITTENICQTVKGLAIGYLTSG
jgi:hypothetical protein